MHNLFGKRREIIKNRLTSLYIKFECLICNVPNWSIDRIIKLELIIFNIDVEFLGK